MKCGPRWLAYEISGLCHKWSLIWEVQTYALSSMVENPDQGALVPGSGGVRKLRWSQPGRGKRGGVRVIYYAKVHEGVIWMLTIYAKNEEQTIPAHVLRKIKEEIDG